MVLVISLDKYLACSLELLANSKAVAMLLNFKFTKYVLINKDVKYIIS